MFCIHCGKEIHANARFCHECGHPAPAAMTAATTHAPAAHVPTSNAASALAVPALWNPNAAVNWSLLFTPIFGAYLQYRNWQAMGDPYSARESHNWFIASITVNAGLIFASAVYTPMVEGTFRSLAVLYLIVWYFVNGNKQAPIVKQKFGGTYPRKGWLAPIGAAILVFIGAITTIVVLELLSR
jgi:hypothetical protein